MTALTLPLCGCATFSSERAIVAVELQAYPTCGTAEQAPASQIHLLQSSDEVRAWQQAHNLPQSEIDNSVEGPFVLVELGAPSEAGNSFIVSREGVVRGGKLRLEATFFKAADAAAMDPCVLLLLPPRRYDRIELYDQEGALRAHTET